MADYELDKALVRLGHEINVITTSDDSENVGSRVIDGVAVTSYRSSRPLYALSAFALVRAAYKLFRTRSQVDIVWIGGVWNLFALLIPIFCRLLKIKYCISPHGMLVPLLIQMKSSFMKRAMLGFGLRSNIKHAHFVHCTVDSECSDVREVVGADVKFFVMPLCFDLTKFDVKDATPELNDKLRIGFVGRVTRKKRLDLLVESISLMSKCDRGRLEILVVGTDVEGLYDRSQKSFGCGEITYLGELYGDDLVELYKSLDVFVLTSESENFAISVVEAAYCSCALLLSRNVGVSTFFVDGQSMLICKLSAEDIAVKLRLLLHDRSLLCGLKIAAKQVSNQFSSNNFDHELLLKVINEQS
ncbi:glycosyltransferase [Marinagarivorans cellulosilyticus]|uniref:glycosyltransferase n=1 Tax=Marinagarivorans cellulosilyticus TaxID=2721545 RepID=UPI001F27B253